jgi:hypothetical protein
MLRFLGIDPLEYFQKLHGVSLFLLDPLVPMHSKVRVAD